MVNVLRVICERCGHIHFVSINQLQCAHGQRVVNYPAFCWCFFLIPTDKFLILLKKRLIDHSEIAYSK